MNDNVSSNDIKNALSKKHGDKDFFLLSVKQDRPEPECCNLTV